MATVNVYIDGFNLYNGLFKNPRRKHPLTNFKWLDLRAVMLHFLAQGDTLGTIYYCTANIIPPTWDPSRQTRQETYLRALEVHSQVAIKLGQFKIRTKSGVPVDKAAHGTNVIKFEAFEEKGTDVNIATLLLRDAFQGACDSAIVVSNDSDLAFAIETTVKDAGRPVMVLSPHLGVTSDLKAVATRNDVITPKVVTKCLLPRIVTAQDGTQYSKPAGW